MKYQINNGGDYETEVAEFIRKYTDIRNEINGIRKGGELHFYASRPIPGRTDQMELTEDELRRALRGAQPIFVAGDNGADPMVFSVRGDVIYTGKDLAELIEAENKKNPNRVLAEPAPQSAPGIFSRLMYNWFGYKTESFKAFEQYSADLDNYQREINREQGRILAAIGDEEDILTEMNGDAHLVKDADAEEVKKKAPKAERAVKESKATVDEAGVLHVGEAAPADPTKGKRQATEASELADGHIAQAMKYDAIDSYLNKAYSTHQVLKQALDVYMNVAEEEKAEAREDLEDAFDQAYFERPKDITVDDMIWYATEKPVRGVSKKFAEDLKNESRFHTSKEERDMHTISEEEYNTLPEADKKNWKKNQQDMYEDQIWSDKKSEIFELPRARAGAGKKVLDEADHSIYDGEFLDETHQKALKGIWAAREEKREKQMDLIVKTIADEIVKDQGEKKVDRSYVERQVRNGSSLTRLVVNCESMDVLASIAETDPKSLKAMYEKELKRSHPETVEKKEEAQKKAADKALVLH